MKMEDVDHRCKYSPDGYHQFRQKLSDGGYSMHHGGYYCIWCLVEVDEK